MKWNEGVFSLRGGGTNSYKDIVRSAGCEISGDYDIPDNFMSYLFFNCINYNQQSEDIFDTKELKVNSIGRDFMYQTWTYCRSLTTAVVPYTTNWNITSISSGFITGAWQGCTSLTNLSMPDTSNWNITSVGNNYCVSTFQGAFANNTTITLKGNLYTKFTLGTNSMGITDSKITNIKVDSGLITTYRNSASWSNITDSKFISW